MQFAHPTKLSKPDPEEVSQSPDPSSSADVVPEITTNAESKKSNVENKKLEPTRFGDWERDGRCIDF